MEYNINHELRIESKIPFQSVENFSFAWEPNKHAVLEVSGYINQNITYEKEAFYNSKIRIWKEQENATIFYGYITKISEENAGNFIRVHIAAQSASCKLDQKTEKRSFQAVEKTYAQIARESVVQGGGQIICTEGANNPIKKPLIQYNETVWEFCKRLASRLTTCIVADITSGEPALWFGMRNGNTIPPLPEEEYTINMIREPRGNGSQTEYQTKSREFYKLGDRTVFCGRRLIICGVSACFEHGELIFQYLLKKQVTCEKIYQKNLIGLGLSGTVVDVKQEQIKVALDIDGGKSTGDYFYNWIPETGNALYAMPEIGARVEVCFGSWDEKDGYAATYLLNMFNSEKTYKNKSLKMKEKNIICLHERNVNINRNEKNSINVSNETASVRSMGQINILAQDHIILEGQRINVNTIDDLLVYHGNL